jgi:hypothetical protein
MHASCSRYCSRLALADLAQAWRTAAQQAQQTPGARCSSIFVLTLYRLWLALAEKAQQQESVSAVTFLRSASGAWHSLLSCRLTYAPQRSWCTMAAHQHSLAPASAASGGTLQCPGYGRTAGLERKQQCVCGQLQQLHAGHSMLPCGWGATAQPTLACHCTTQPCLLVL